MCIFAFIPTFAKGGYFVAGTVVLGRGVVLTQLRSFHPRSAAVFSWHVYFVYAIGVAGVFGQVYAYSL